MQISSAVIKSQIGGRKPVILVLGRWRQEGHPKGLLGQRGDFSIW